ncbi:Lsr2 family protein [Gordonia sp. N1V]|uniref:histone-like nucleoid-structuring protein Lsr2 n=1 Tax=Gordonia sp. N1V TaxID=3034163 RepID=UPI0023E143BC|nr:Lsr2 family protein [Gordonia sp. N1V]MDF3284971.1 Lsr2 family protein [Gordonia sp. N1V]
MARVELTTFIDDLDGTLLEIDDVHSVDWSWNGVAYRLDVSSGNLDKIEKGTIPLTTLLGRSTRAGIRLRTRTSSRVRKTPKSGANSRTVTTTTAAQIREWATTHGYDVSARGRITNAVHEAYTAAGH